MKFLYCFLILAVIIPATLAAENVVIGSGHPDWSPIMYKSDDKIVGIGPNLASAIFNDIGFKFNCTYFSDWNKVLSLGSEGKIDVIVAAYKTPEREESFLYSEPYFSDPISLFSTQDSFTYSKPEDLIGNRIAVTAGDSYGKELDEFLAIWGSRGNLTLNVYNTPEQALNSLQKGESDGFLYSAYAGRKALNASPEFKDIKEVGIVSYQPFYLLISKKSEYVELMPLVNNLITVYKSNGELEKIINNST